MGVWAGVGTGGRPDLWEYMYIVAAIRKFYDCNTGLCVPPKFKELKGPFFFFWEGTLKNYFTDKQSPTVVNDFFERVFTWNGESIHCWTGWTSIWQHSNTCLNHALLKLHSSYEPFTLALPLIKSIQPMTFRARHVSPRPLSELIALVRWRVTKRELFKGILPSLGAPGGECLMKSPQSIVFSSRFKRLLFSIHGNVVGSSRQLRSVSWENLADTTAACSYGYLFHFEKIISYGKWTGLSKRSCSWYHWVIPCLNPLPAAWVDCGNETWKLVMCVNRLLLSMIALACLSSYYYSGNNIFFGCILYVIFFCRWRM